jgi:hypothetical protein
MDIEATLSAVVFPTSQRALEEALSQTSDKS